MAKTRLQRDTTNDEKRESLGKQAAPAWAMQGDAAMSYIARIKYTFARYLARRYQPPTDKMAEYFFNFGRKWQTKNLRISKKSSTFVA